VPTNSLTFGERVPRLRFGLPYTAIALDLRDGHRLPLVTLIGSAGAPLLKAWLMERLHLAK
jgi:hypothetical protein